MKLIFNFVKIRKCRKTLKLSYYKNNFTESLNIILT